MKQENNSLIESILSDCEKSIGYVFQDKRLLKMALTHSSYANEYNTESYERLEFLGDSVLSLVTSTHIFKNYKSFPEGKLTKLRAILVCEETLAKLSLKNSIDKYMFLGAGEKIQNGAQKPSILADIFESIAGAIYIDGGYEKAKRYIADSMEDEVQQQLSTFLIADHKTVLQEYAAKLGETVQYTLVGETGPDHQKIFEMEVSTCGKTAVGTGRSKKEAQQEAAKKYLENEGMKC